MRFFDADGDGKIGFNECVRGLALFLYSPEEKVIGKRHFKIFDVLKEGALSVQGVGQVLRDRLFIQAEVQALELFWTLKNEKQFKKGYGDEAKAVIRDAVMKALEDGKIDTKIVTEIWTTYNKPQTEKIPADDWERYFDGHQYEVERLWEGPIREFAEEAKNAATAALSKGK